MRSSRIVLAAGTIIIASFLLCPLLFASQESLAKQQDSPTIEMTTDLVSLNVTVTDKKGRAISGLNKDAFKVYENGVEQPISFFSADERPVSWGLVLDRSGSMREMMREVYQAALHVIDEGTEQDEMFIVTFNDRAELVCGLTSDRHKLENSAFGLRADGQTALYDAVSFALDEIRNGKHQKKALVVVTDGEDNSSRIDLRDLIEKVEEQNVLIYTVGMFESMGGRMFGWRPDNGQLEKLSEVTGAEAHFPTTETECREVMKKIAVEVSRQYSLGYYPTDSTRDGLWRKIKISVVGKEKKDPKYAVRTRGGYYASKDGSKKYGIFNHEKH